MIIRHLPARARQIVFSLLFAGCTIIMSLYSITGTAQAAQAQGNNTLRVSPALSNVQLTPGETSTTVAVMVSNLTTAPLVVGMSARDFGASPTNASTVNFYGTGYNPATNPHGLQNSVSFASPSVTIGPNSSEKVMITLNNIAHLAPGGHYGAILFSPESLAASSGGVKVAIRSAVASLLFLNTATGGTQALGLLPLSVGTLHFSLPSTSNIVLKNDGNTQSAPIGQLSLYGPSGSLVSTTVLNPGSGLVLPGSSTLFTVMLPLLHTRFARPGKYRLELQYRDSAQANFTVVNKEFFLINLWVIIPFILLCLLLAYLARRHGGKLPNALRWLVQGVKHVVQWVRRRFVKKQPPPPEPPKPKRPKLIQG